MSKYDETMRDIYDAFIVDAEQARFEEDANQNILSVQRRLAIFHIAQIRYYVESRTRADIEYIRANKEIENMLI